MPRRRDPLIAGLALALACACQQRPGPAPPDNATPRGPSVLLVTVDTLRADAVGAYGGGTAAGTPVLDSLAARGTLFDAAYAVAPITLTSHATLVTGLYPPGHGARHNGIRMRDGVATLAERFRAAGARTAAFVSAFPVDASFGLARGFERYSDRMPRGPDGRLANERPGRATVDEAIAWLRERGTERFFVWVHLFEPHAPYGRPGADTPPRVRYAAEVAEADRQIGRLLDSLAGRRDETIVLATSDHGEAFGEHAEIAHSLFVYDTTLRVPLIVAGPGVREDTRVAAAVSLVDVAPTLAALGGLSPFDVDGEDLRTLMAGGTPGRNAASHRPIYAESFAPLLDFGWSSLRTVRQGRWKYIAAPRPELYDLDSDPAEERNVFAQGSSEAARLAGAVEKISGPELTSAPTAASDPESRRRLQALGYASGRHGARAGARRDPKDGRILAAQLASVASGELQGAALGRALESILRLDPDNPQASLRLGFLRIDAGRCREAEALFARAIAREIPGSDAWLGLATCQGRRGAVREALRSLEAARAREPRNPVVVANIGIARARLGDAGGALGALTEALALDPDLHEARFNLALVHAREGRREEAGREARELLRRLPSDAPQRQEVERLLRAVR